MAEKLHPVAIGEMVVSADPEEILVAYGLGSCVAICLYDPLARVGGMLHALLPAPTQSNRQISTPTKFVALGVPLLLRELVDRGARSLLLKTYLCGGACVLTTLASGLFDIGQHNIQAATTALWEAKLKIHGQATGGRVGRTVKFHLVSGQVMVKSLGQPEELLSSQARPDRFSQSKQEEVS